MNTLILQVRNGPSKMDNMNDDKFNITGNFYMLKSMIMEEVQKVDPNAKVYSNGEGAIDKNPLLAKMLIPASGDLYTGSFTQLGTLASIDLESNPGANVFILVASHEKSGEIYYKHVVTDMDPEDFFGSECFCELHDA